MTRDDTNAQMQSELFKCSTCGHEIKILYWDPPARLIHNYECDNIGLDKCCKASWDAKVEELLRKFEK